MSKKNPSVAFDRVSSKDQRDGFSLEAQEKLSGNYATENNLVIVKRWSVNESASKENDRKYFFELIEYVRENNIQDVLFDRVDRACRGLKSAQLIEELVEKRGVRFHFTRDRLVIDVNSPSTEKLRFYLHVILAKYYIDNLKGEIKKGLDQREAQGYWNHKAPIGYKNVRRDLEGKVTTDKHGKAMVEVDEPLVPVVKEIFELYATGNYAYHDLARILNEKTAPRKVALSYIEQMICNPFYYGAMRVRGNVIAGKHQPLISKQLWEACQKIKALRGENHQASHANVTPKPFMGFLRCGLCEHGITGQVKKKASGKTYVYYHCANQNCPERRVYVPEHVIERQVIAAFAPFSKFTPNATNAFVEALRSGLGNLDLFSNQRTVELAGKQAEIRKGIEALKDLKAKGLLSEKEFDEVMAQKGRSLVQAETEIQATIGSNDSTRRSALEVIELLTNVKDFMLLDQNLLEKARFAKMVLSNLILKSGKLQFHYQKPFDVLIDLTAKKNWWS